MNNKKKVFQTHEASVSAVLISNLQIAMKIWQLYRRQHCWKSTDKHDDKENIKK